MKFDELKRREFITMLGGARVPSRPRTVAGRPEAAASPERREMLQRLLAAALAIVFA
jgi:hypothetical protein